MDTDATDVVHADSADLDTDADADADVDAPDADVEAANVDVAVAEKSVKPVHIRGIRQICQFLQTTVKIH
jgi:hypothetical protein